MDRDVLLDGKTNSPGLRPGLISRPRLLALLADGLAAGRALTLVSAPAGFGKTTLLAEWASRAGRPAAWLSLEESENDPALFLRYLMESIRKSAGEISLVLPQLMQPPQSASPMSVLPAVLNEISRAEPFLLILDDYHLVTAPGVHEIVAFLLEHLPPSLHVAIGTREDPPLPLARLRAGGLVTELREADLRFSTAETEEFLARSMNLALPPLAVETLEARTEGWVAGLQLAAFALKKEGGRPEKFLAAFSGDHRYVMDYLVVEVLERLPPETRDFLRRTAILDRLSAPLCDSVTGREGSQALLEQLEASNIFLFPLDSRREWYRYHRLFAEFLKARLSPAEETALQRRAAAWYESHRMPFLAVRHALDAGALSGDYAEAARLVRAAAEEGIREGRSQTLLDWMRSLPGKMLSTDPELMLYKGWALTLTGGFPEAVVLAAQAEQAAAAGAGGRSVRGKIALLQAFLALMQRGDLPETVRRAERAIEDLQAGGEQWLPMAHWLLAEPYERMGQLEQAIRTLKESRKVLPATLSHLFTDLVDIMLVYDLNLAGKRREALEICRETLRRRDSTEEGSSPTSCMLLARQAMLHYEADELNRARELYGQAVEYGRRHRQEPFVTFARGTCAQLLLALGKTNDAAEALDQAVDAARQSGLTDLGTVLAARANFRLQLGDEDSVRRWIEEAGCSDDEEPQYLRLDTQLVYVRWLLRRGSLDRAGQTLSRLRAFLEPAGIRRPLITVRILSALLADRRGDRPSAVDHLAAAVRLASPEDYLRVFLEEEPRTLSLLPAVRDADPPFIDRLLSAAARTPAAVDLSAPPGPLPAGPRSGGEDVLAEPLSVREIEILRLLAKGLSNSQIAERLVIALATVKRHVQNIYGKLGVNSRTQAVAEGRRRKLVE